MHHMELFDSSSQRQDGCLPHLTRLAPHAHGQLYLDTVHLGQLAVTPHYEAAVVVTKLAWPNATLELDVVIGI